MTQGCLMGKGSLCHGLSEFPIWYRVTITSVPLLEYSPGLLPHSSSKPLLYGCQISGLEGGQDGKAVPPSQ